MSWEEEKEIYVKKLENIISGIEKIEQLHSNNIITEEMRKGMNNLSAEAQKMLPKLKNGEFSIAVVGLEKAGKSSFANALTDLAVLPTDDQRCTYTATCIRPDKEDHAKITFYTRDEFTRDFREKLLKLEIKNAENYTLNTLSLSEYEKSYEDTSESVQRSYGDNLNLDIRNILENKEELQRYIGKSPREFSGSELEGEEFASFIKNPARAVAVKEVVVYSSQLKSMPNAVLYDVPGFDSPTAMHREQTLDKMSEADAIIMVAAANKPSLTSPALSIFKNHDIYGCTLDKKMFVFANKADAVATKQKLDENKEVTYDEWIIKRKLLLPEYKHRIIFGSANAHLGDKVPGGTESAAKLAEYGYTSGIEDFRKKLKEYYENERFEILKIRINTILTDVQRIFSDIDSTCDSDLSFGTDESHALILKVRRELKQKLANSLQKFKHDINIESNTEHPLKEKMSSLIVETVTREKYAVTDELIEEINIAIGNISGTEQPRKLDGELRERQFRKMHDDFTKMIVGSAVERHNNISDKIIKLFTEAMKISESLPKYEDIKKDIASFCSLDGKENEAYYQSLVERFARDMFEVQIKSMHGSDRFKKFQEEAANFYSLSVFYSQSEDKENFKLNGQSLRNNSPYLRLILYPDQIMDYSSSVTSDSIVGKLREQFSMIELTPVMTRMVTSIVRHRGNLAAVAIEQAISGISTAGQNSIVIANQLSKSLASLAPTEDSDKENILDESRYLEYRRQKNMTDSYEQVRREFGQDVEALRDGLLKACVPAINLDKAFSAKETKLIEDIVAELDTEAFEKFVVRNLQYIEYDAMNKIRDEQYKRKLDNAVKKEIREILNNISNTDN